MTVNLYLPALLSCLCWIETPRAQEVTSGKILEADDTPGNDTFIYQKGKNVFVNAGTLVGVAVGLIALLSVLLSFFVIWRQRKQQVARRRKREEDERVERERREIEEREEERRRLPELWCNQQIPVETEGRGVCRSELGHEQRIPVETDGQPSPGVELVGSHGGNELGGSECVLDEKEEERMVIHELQSDELLDPELSINMR